MSTAHTSRNGENGVPSPTHRPARMGRALDDGVSEFDDEAVLPAWLPTALAQARAKLKALRADAQPSVGDIELPSADSEVLEHLRACLERDERLYL